MNYNYNELRRGTGESFAEMTVYSAFTAWHY